MHHLMTQQKLIQTIWTATDSTSVNFLQ